MSLLPEISQASTEINKLVAQANIHQTIAPVNPAAFTDPADTALLASRDPVIREVSVGMTGEAYSVYSVSGTPPLTLPNSLGKPLKAWSVDLLPYQEGTGDPAPDNVRPIHGTDKVTVWTSGKNLYDGVQYPFKQYSIYNPTVAWTDPILLQKGTYTFSCNSGFGRCYLNCYATLADAMSNTNVIYQGNFGNGESLTHSTNTDIYVRYQQNQTSGTDDGYNLVSRSWQTEFGSTATDYVPYVAQSSTVIPLPSTVYTATIGESGGESRWGIYQPTASEMFWSSSSKASFYIPNWVDTITMRGNAICSHFARFVGGWVEMPVNSFQAHVDRVGINIENVSDTAGVQAYVQAQIDAGTPIQFLFELATPTTFAVTAPTIPTPTGTATAWATAEDGTVESMEVTYVKSE